MRKALPLILSLFILLCACTQSPSPVTEDPITPSPSPSSALSPPPSNEPSPVPQPSPSPVPEPSPVPLEEYTGALYHVFYHFLNAFPDIASKTDYWRSLDAVCVGPKEFWRSLEELYKNDFVIVNLNDYNEVGEDGVMRNKPIMVPVGKKPVVLSFDDINYYSKNLGKGTCDKVILDSDGKFAMSTVQKDGTELITYDNDVIPMLEEFCEQYPDFSPFGSKGLLALTGYDGILGYRTQRDSPNRESEIEAVAPIVQALLDSGWYFGSHSYSHFHMRDVNLARVKDDTQKWLDEVGSLVGDTRLYIFPYGEYTAHDDERFQHILNSGFSMLCGVGMPPYYRKYDTYAFMDRQFIDGTSLRNHRKWLLPLMDPDIVYCPEERNNVPLSTPALAGVVDDKGIPVYRESSTVTVAFGGDVALVGSVAAALQKDGADGIISPELAEVFRSADIAMVNLESAISGIGEPEPDKEFTFRANPDVLDFLRDALSVDVVSVANNHTIDYGRDAFEDTLERLKNHGIGYTGGGFDLDEAMSPYVADFGTVSVAFLAASQIAPTMDWYAKEERSGLLMAYDPSLICQAVKEAKSLYDYVVVYMHWGVERETEPTALQVNTAHKMLDAGADAVIGSHPHVIQSFEVYNGKPIVYSLGNFLMRNGANNTAVVILTLEGGRARLEVVPCTVEHLTYVRRSSEKRAKELLYYWQSISENAVITQNGFLE